jgi:protein-tyrosine-phosphatase
VLVAAPTARRRGSASYTPLIDVLFACTGNICRSPMAEALLRERLAGRAPSLTIGSVGRLFDGRAPEKGAVKAMAGYGIDLTSHVSRKQTPALIADSALILTMEKVHVRDLSVLAPGTFDRTFTLPEFVRIVEEAPPRTDANLRRWVEGLGADREHLGYLASTGDDEIADPMGRSARTFRACAAEIDGLLERMVERVWPASVAASR